MATLSVRMERGARQESAALATRVRHAADGVRPGPVDEVERLFDGLADDPRGHLRKLRRSPEGVDRLIVGLAGAARRPDPRPQAGLDRLAPGAGREPVRPAGRRRQGGRGSGPSRGRPGATSRAWRATRGAAWTTPPARRWARARLVERVDAAVAELEAHRETLDHEAIELDRPEAGDRALFDPSQGGDAGAAGRVGGASGVLQGAEGVPPGRGGGGGRRAGRVGPGAGPALEPEPGPGDRPASRAVGFVLGRVIADPGRPAPGLRGGDGNPGSDRPRPRRPAFEDRPARPGVRLSREIPYASVPPSRNGSGARLQFDRGSNLRRVPARRGGSTPGSRGRSTTRSSD